MKILFMGTPDFAVNSLKTLYEAGHEISAVVTIQDKPRGRGHKMTHTPVYNAAEEIGAPIYTPSTLKKDEFEQILLNINPEVIVVVAYGKILPEYVLNYPKYGCINVHASLLPKYRGAAPIQRAIIDGEKLSGVTTMYMEKGLDTGDMLLKAEVEITEEDTFATLHDKLSDAGALLICKTLEKLSTGECIGEKQNDAQANYAHMITKETCLIDWNKNADDVYNLIRGLNPFPKAFSYYEGRQMKILSAKISQQKTDSKSGTIISVGKDCFTVACGNSTCLDIYEIQQEGKKVMSVSEFLRGNSINENIRFGG